ncbi:sensor histidine kinase [Lapidilactobacillus mulanensis]|uniref:Sensor histidine kinase n=1 Tax=Lapidilactobacillus mulanensis TaxID=2485999 RepID=A0ABW4DNW1_9LACO|nr:sensor histidine kinase [Lapidilactobacillus mulanensis]
MSRLRSVWLFTLIMIGTLVFSFIPIVGAAKAGNDWEMIRFTMTQEILDLPLIIYLIVGAALFSLLIVMLVNWLFRQSVSRQLNSINGILHGNFVVQQAKGTLEFTAQEKILRQRYQQLNERIVSLQQELQVYSNQPLRFEGETREEILEGERHRLARELHDSVSQQLFAAMMMLSALNESAKQNQIADNYQQLITKIEAVINQAQSEMRALLLHLRPTSLEGRSLKEGLIQLLKELQTKIKIKISWEMDEVKLQSGVEDNLFRIVQELLSNTLRHANADQMQVFLKQVKQTVVLRVVDNGVGFDMQQQEKAGSYGLTNIKERAESVGGTVKIISFKNEGTSVEVRVPIVMEENHD